MKILILELLYFAIVYIWLSTKIGNNLEITDVIILVGTHTIAWVIGWYVGNYKNKNN